MIFLALLVAFASGALAMTVAVDFADGSQWNVDTRPRTVGAIGLAGLAVVLTLVAA